MPLVFTAQKAAVAAVISWFMPQHWNSKPQAFCAICPLA